MSDGKAIPVWYPEKDRLLVEQAAALAGYKHLSTYIRDQSLQRGPGRAGAGRSLETWADLQELNGRLADIERGQRSIGAQLAVVLFLITRKASAIEMQEVRSALAAHGLPEALILELLPELAPGLIQPL
ncbi:hypothetical protein [Chromobacterium vaccinii]|uniref:hypothetical protein n=1 Tax=Chromobacterium vaccinii TaxID=1108595 RepID=UPI003459915E